MATTRNSADTGTVSTKPVIERLQVKGARTFAVAGLRAGEGVVSAGLAADLAASVEVSVEAADVVLAFFADRAGLEAELAVLRDRVKAGAILWIGYPKLTSRLAGDLSRDVIHGLTPAYGLDTVSQIALDADWSAMRMKRVG